MHPYAFSHLADAALLQALTELIRKERATTAEVLACLAEVDERKLYLPAAYPSMYAYCIDRFGFTADAAYKRIQAARAARAFPAILPGLADGRLCLTAVGLLAPHLTTANADDLLARASHKSKGEIRALLAQRFRAPEAPMLEPPNAGSSREPQLAPEQVGELDSQRLAAVLASDPDSRRPADGSDPSSPGMVALRALLSRGTHEKLRYAQALLGHAVPSGDIARVLDRALDALIEKVERERFAATSRSSSRRSRGLGRYIPADVRRAVWQRDQGRCTFTSASGHRCESRMRLEFDHVTPVAQGGRSTVDGIRLLCRAHNQMAAEQRLGKPFMQAKRELAQRHRAEARAHRNAAEVRARARRASIATPALTSSEDDDVVKALRTLGFKPHEARASGAAALAALPNGSVEDRLRHALRQLAPRCERRPVRVAGVRANSSAEERTQACAPQPVGGALIR